MGWIAWGCNGYGLPIQKQHQFDTVPTIDTNNLKERPEQPLICLTDPVFKCQLLVLSKTINTFETQLLTTGFGLSDPFNNNWQYSRRFREQLELDKLPPNTPNEYYQEFEQLFRGLGYSLDVQADHFYDLDDDSYEFKHWVKMVTNENPDYFKQPLCELVQFYYISE